MLTPKDAFDLLISTNRFGIDDPTQGGDGIPLRWYFDGEGVLCSCWWRSKCPVRHEEYQRQPVTMEARR